MKRRTLFIIGGVALATGVLAYSTWCCLDWMAKRYVGHSAGSIWASGTWPKVLNLTPEQKTKILGMEKTLKTHIDAIQVELTQNQINLCRMLMSPEMPDKNNMLALVGNTSNLQRLKEEMTLNHLVALREILTPEQQNKLFTTMMQDICVGCRNSTGSHKDYCGMCAIGTHKHSAASTGSSKDYCEMCATTSHKHNT